MWGSREGRAGRRKAASVAGGENAVRISGTPGAFQRQACGGAPCGRYPGRGEPFLPFSERRGSLSGASFRSGKLEFRTVAARRGGIRGGHGARMGGEARKRGVFPRQARAAYPGKARAQIRRGISGGEFPESARQSSAAARTKKGRPAFRLQRCLLFVAGAGPCRASFVSLP